MIPCLLYLLFHIIDYFPRWQIYRHQTTVSATVKDAILFHLQVLHALPTYSICSSKYPRHQSFNLRRTDTNEVHRTSWKHKSSYIRSSNFTLLLWRVIKWTINRRYCSTYTIHSPLTLTKHERTSSCLTPNLRQHRDSHPTVKYSNGAHYYPYLCTVQYTRRSWR